MKHLLPCCAGIVLSTAALASGPQSESVRASMLVTGTIQEAPDGSVATYAIDHPESLPPAVRSLLTAAFSVLAHPANAISEHHLGDCEMGSSPPGTIRGSLSCDQYYV